MGDFAEGLEKWRKYQEDPIKNPKINWAPFVQKRTKPLSIITDADFTNGKQMDKYCWSQDIQELIVRVPIPNDVKKGKDVHVEIKKKFLEVWLMSDKIPILNHELEDDIDVRESFWTLCPGEAVNINLVKVVNRYWGVLTKDDKVPIDDTKIVSGKNDFKLGTTEPVQLTPNLPPPRLEDYKDKPLPKMRQSEAPGASTSSKASTSTKKKSRRKKKVVDVPVDVPA